MIRKQCRIRSTLTCCLCGLHYAVLSLCALERQGLSLTVVSFSPKVRSCVSQIWSFFVLSLCFSSSITFSKMLSTIAKTYKLSRMSLYEWKLTSLNQPDANLLACNWGNHVVLLFIALKRCCFFWELERNGKVTLPSKEFRIYYYSRWWKRGQ